MRTLRMVSFLLTGLVSACGSATPVVTIPNQATAPPVVTPAPAQPIAQPIEQPPLVQEPAKPTGPAISSGPGDFIARFVDKNGKPVEGLEVTIANTKEKQLTDAKGTVKFEDLPANSQYETYHNDYVQRKEKVPFTADGMDIPLILMADWH